MSHMAIVKNIKYKIFYISQMLDIPNPKYHMVSVKYLHMANV
jgi:hypothetical protein